MGKSIKVQKKPRSTVKDKPRKRQDTPDWDDGHDKYMLLNVFHLLNVGKPNFRQLSEAMGKRAYSEHHLRNRFRELRTSRAEIKKYRERIESLFMSDEDSESDDDFRNVHSEVHVVIGDGVESEQPSPGSDATFESPGTDSGYGPTSSASSVTASPTPCQRRSGTRRVLPSREAQSPRHESYTTGSRPRADLYRPANHSRRARSLTTPGLPADAPRQPAAHRRERSRRRPESTRNSGHKVNITSSLNVNTTRRDDRRNSSRRG